jgi:hypothetical protein
MIDEIDRVAAEERDVVTAAIKPGLWKIADEVARVRGLLRRAAVNVAKARYERAEGEPPASVDELAPRLLDAVPIDPMTGEPMRLDEARATPGETATP